MNPRNTNTASINAQMNLSKVNKEMESAMAQLSSGKRINTASDDAAGMAIASRMNAEITGINMAIRNASDGQALIDTAEGAHVEIENMLQRARELAVQASNDTNSDDDRASLQLEIDQILTEIDRTAANTSWAGKTLMGGETGGASDFTFQIGTGDASSDRVAVSIGDTSSTALGIGVSGGSSGGRTSGPAGLLIDGGRVTVQGKPKQGDTFEFSINDVEVDIIFSTTDQYTDDVAGVAAQLKDDIDALVAAGTLSAMTVTNNGDGTLDIVQSSTPVLTSATVTDGDSGGDTASISGSTITLSGDYDNTTAVDVVAVVINGITATYTQSASDGFDDGILGAAAGLKSTIENTNGLENVIVTDNGDGSLSFAQSTTPFLESAEVNLTTDEAIALAYDDAATSSTAGVITISGGFVAGQQMSFDLFGETVSFTTSEDDGYSDTLAGVANQLAVAINNAGISGISAAKDASANTVTITADVIAGNGVVNSGDEFVVTSVGAQASATIEISGTDVGNGGTATAASYAVGDAYTFEVAGQEFSVVVGTDGYTNDLAGLSAQMKDTIDAAGIVGLTVTANTATTAGVSLTRTLTGTTANQGGSTVVTNIQSLAADEVAEAINTGAISVSSATNAADAINRIDAALLAINTQRAELGAVSNRMDHTINNLSNVSSNLQSGMSRIQDADFAKVTGDLTKSQIMSQAATAMLAQANASKQGVLSLLQG